MLVFPLRQQIWPVGEAAHDAVHVVLRDGLQDNTAKLVFEKLHLGAGFNPMFAAKFGWNHKLALGCKRTTYFFHDLHDIISKTSGRMHGWSRALPGARA